MTKNFITQDDIADIHVQMLTNSLYSTPNPPAYSGYLNYRKKLLDSGINIFELQAKDSIHAKSYVFDKELLAIGSFNLDHRSAYLSTESMVIIQSEDIVNKFTEQTSNYISKSLLVDGNYSYSPKEGVDELPVNLFKSFIIKLLSFITRWFEYLL